MTSQFATPVGRVVWGSPGKEQVKKNQRTKQPVIDQKTGQPAKQWVFGLAIPKDQFNQHVWPHLSQAAAAVHGQAIPADFAWKVKDGDGVDGTGKPYSNREGYPGHYVLSISTEAFAPPIYKFENGAYRQITAQEIKCGDYVSVNVTVKHNGQTAGNGAGLYVNPNGIELIGYGTEIITGADPDEMFANVNRALPPGASPTPVSSAPGGAGGMPMQQPVQQAQPGFGAPMQQQPMQQPSGQLPPPATDFVNNAVNGGMQQQPMQQQQQQQPMQQQPGGFPVNTGQPGGFPVNTGQPGGFPVNTGQPGGFPVNTGQPGGFPGQTPAR